MKLHKTFGGLIRRKKRIEEKENDENDENDETRIVKLDDIIISKSASTTSCDSGQKEEDCGIELFIRPVDSHESFTSAMKKSNLPTVPEEKTPKSAENMIKFLPNDITGEITENLAQVSPEETPNLAMSSSDSPLNDIVGESKEKLSEVCDEKNPKSAKNSSKSSSITFFGESNANLPEVLEEALVETNPKSVKNSCRSSSSKSFFGELKKNLKTPKSAKNSSKSSSITFFGDMKANLPKIFGEITPKSVKNSCRSSSSKNFFGGMTPKSKNMLKSSSNGFKMIAVDEKEQLVDVMSMKSSGNASTKSGTKSSGYNGYLSSFSKDSGNFSQSTVIRSNVGRIGTIGKKTSQQRGSHLRQTRSNSSANARIKNKSLPVVTRGLKDFSDIIANDTKTQRSKTPKAFASTAFNFVITLDSIEGIRCTNDRGEIKNLDKTMVVLSYFEPSSGGVNKRRNIRSQPIKKDSSNGNLFYKANFMSDRNSFKFPATMIKDRNTESGYEAQNLYLQVNLKKGKEMIRLGHALLPLNGNEAGTKRSIPIGNILITTSKACNNASVSQASKISTRGMKSFSFSSDVKTKYVLRNASLQVSSIRAEVDIELNSMVITPDIGECVSNLSDNEAVYASSVSPSKEINHQYSSAIKTFLGLEEEANNQGNHNNSDHDVGCKGFSCRNFEKTDEESLNQTNHAVNELRNKACLYTVMGDDNPMNKMCSDIEMFTSDDDSGINESDDDDDSSDSSGSSSDESDESTRKDFEF